MAAPTDAAIHALGDPDMNLRGYRILRRVTNGNVHTSYYIQTNTIGHGQSGWIDIADSQTAAQADTAIRARFHI
jgi:hypothetical protein